MSEPRRFSDGSSGLDRVQAQIRRLQTQSGEGDNTPETTPDPAVPSEISPEPKAPTRAKKPVLPATPAAEVALAVEPVLPKRVHPNQRGYVQASNEIAQLRGQVVPDKPTISYYSPELIQCTLPHSDPKNHVWVRENGSFSLVVSSGFDSKGNAFGIPYGPFPRLMLAYIETQVVKTREKRIELSAHFGGFIREIGYTGNHRGNSEKGRRIKDQISRLLNANIAFRYDESSPQAERNAAHQMHIAPKFDLWWDFRNAEQGVLFNSWVELSDEFYKAILASHVPLRTDILKGLHQSAMDLDVYMWVSYRLFRMQAAGEQELHVPFGMLQAQFGTGIAEENYRLFRQRIKQSFAKVAQYWRPHDGDPEHLQLNYEFTEKGVMLFRTPLLIPRGNRSTDKELTAHLFANRDFDVKTRAKARVIANNHNLDFVTKQYFDWVEAKNIVPANPDAHFLSFVRRHVKRNPL